jgi:RimJ/RimL family protein N-acetyltransferase
VGLDVTITEVTDSDQRELDEFVWSLRGELNRTLDEAIDLAEQLYDDKHTQTWIAREKREGLLVGFVALHSGRKASDRHTASLRILIDRGFRDEGIGQRLIEVVPAWAARAGITRITATPYLKGGLGLYSSIFERNGFVKEGIMRGAVKEGETLRDVALLARVT